VRSYRWADGGLVACEPAQGPFTVADSWRHSRGRAHGFAEHIARFEATAGPLPRGFLVALLGVLDPSLELFPRIALSQGQLLVDVRVAPTARTRTTLTYVHAATDTADPRTQPLVKGPDFPAFAAYRKRHQVAGTDDTVITDADGALLETTTGALVAWVDDALVVPDGVWLPSITLAQVAERARTLGIGVDKQKLSLELCASAPLWFLNSLHGVSPVSELRAGEQRVTPPTHPNAANWQAWWWEGFESVTTA